MGSYDLIEELFNDLVFGTMDNSTFEYNLELLASASYSNTNTSKAQFEIDMLTT